MKKALSKNILLSLLITSSVCARSSTLTLSSRGSEVAGGFLGGLAGGMIASSVVRANTNNSGVTQTDLELQRARDQAEQIRRDQDRDRMEQLRRDMAYQAKEKTRELKKALGFQEEQRGREFMLMMLLVLLLLGALVGFGIFAYYKKHPRH